MNCFQTYCLGLVFGGVLWSHAPGQHLSAVTSGLIPHHLLTPGSVSYLPRGPLARKSSPGFGCGSLCLALATPRQDNALDTVRFSHGNGA